MGKIAPASVPRSTVPCSAAAVPTAGKKSSQSQNGVALYPSVASHTRRLSSSNSCRSTPSSTSVPSYVARLNPGRLNELSQQHSRLHALGRQAHGRLCVSARLYRSYSIGVTSSHRTPGWDGSGGTPAASPRVCEASLLSSVVESWKREPECPPDIITADRTAVDRRIQKCTKRDSCFQGLPFHFARAFR